MTAGHLLNCAAAGQASVIFETAALTGAAEIPPTGSPGTGLASVLYDSVLHTLTVDVSFTGLLGTTTASHIHCCIAQPGNAGVATTTPTFAGFPLGVTSGTYHTVLDLTLASSWNPAFISANGGTTASAEATLASGLANDETYLNIHTTVDPGGEIRGVLVSPEPATWTLMGTSLLGLLGARRRRLF